MKRKSAYVMCCVLALVVLMFVNILLTKFEGNVYAAGNSGEMETVELQKDETIYGILKNNGAVDSIYVVNHFAVPQDGRYTDYGQYINVENLSNVIKPKVTGNLIHWDLDKNDQGFYYKGELSSRELPWEINIRYLLDGKEVKAEKLGGARGVIEIYIYFSTVEEAEEYFAKNYLAQIQIPINQRSTKIIAAEGANKVVVGETATLSYTVMPKDSTEFKLVLESNKFEMDAINFVVSPFNLAQSLDMNEVNDGFTSLSSGMEEMIEGTTEFQRGMVDLNRGISHLTNGQRSLTENGNKIISAMEQYDLGLKNFNLPMQEMVNGSQNINEGLTQISTEGIQLEQGYNHMAEGISAQLPSEEEKALLVEMAKLAQSPDPIQAQMGIMAVAMIKQLEGMEEVYNNLNMLNQGLNRYIGGVSELSGHYNLFHNNIEGLPRVTGELEKGFDSILAGNKEFMGGVSYIGLGMAELEKSVQIIPADMEELVKGQRMVRDGIDEAGQSIKEKLGLIEGEEAEPVSFVSPKEGSINTVQFILKTPGIKAPSETNKTIEEKTNAKGLLNRFLSLFKR